jgi:hypothetical protein
MPETMERPVAQDTEVSDLYYKYNADSDKWEPLEGQPEPGSFTGVMEELCSKGDIKYMWDKNVPSEVEAARTQFELLVKKNRTHLAYKVKDKDGEKSNEVIREFDPELERVIFHKATVGG